VRTNESQAINSGSRSIHRASQLIRCGTKSIRCGNDYYLADSGSLLGLSADLKFRTPGDPLYLGGGLNIMRASAGGSSNNDTGFDLFAGLETRYGWSHPYVEVRGLFHSGSAVQGAFGLNITLR